MSSPLQSAACIWLTTLRADGSPHTSPVWFVTDDEEETVYVGTSASTVKTRNVRADLRVSLAVDGTGADPWVAQARVTVHDPVDRGRWDDVLTRFAAKYDGWDAADPTYYGPRVLLELEVTRWLLRPA